MSITENAATALGLDIGTSRIVLALHRETGFEFRSQLNAFVTVPYSRMTECSLVTDGTPYEVCDGEIFVFGNEAERLAAMLNTEIRRPMLEGMLNPEEPGGLTAIRKIVASLTAQEEQRGYKVRYVVPAAVPGSNITYHAAAIRQVLEEFGFEAESINEGLAVVYGELEDTNYTGIGVSCGGGMCNVCLSYLSVPVRSFSLPKAGDYIDANAAAATGELSLRVRLFKESQFQFNGAFADKIPQALNIYYDDMIQDLVRAMAEAFAASRSLPRTGRQMPIVLSGGSALPGGFRERFEAALRQTDFPLPVSEVRLAAEPLHSTAKGALMAALADA